MKKVLSIFLVLLLVCGVANALDKRESMSSDTKSMSLYGATSDTGYDAKRLRCDSNGYLITTSGGSGTGDINISEIGGNAVDVGAGTIGSATQRVTIATDDQTAANIDNTSGTHDSAAPSKVVMQGQYAETAVPAAVADGDAVRANYNEYGQARDASYNYSQNSNNVVNIAPELSQTIEYIDSPLLNAVTATGASADVNVSGYNKMTFHIIASSVTTGGTVVIQSSLDGTNYVDVDTTTVSADGTTEVVIENRKYKYVRANITARTDGTYTVLAIIGR